MRVLVAGDPLAAGMLGEMLGQHSGPPAPDVLAVAGG
jgi:hypothetical protein